jgi:hypothetical protein
MKAGFRGSEILATSRLIGFDGQTEVGELLIL